MESNKILGIMQPYFFPYLGYFMLMRSVDKYIFFDTTQYVKGSWFNRNRIINIKDGSTFINVPVTKQPLDTPTNKTLINYNIAWQQQIIAQLEVYKKRASYYKETIALVRDIIEQKYESIAALNINSNLKVLQYLDINLNFDIHSDMGIEIQTELKADEDALYLSKQLGYSKYINAIGGKEFYDVEKYSENGVDIKFLKPQLSVYDQKIGRFESGLSIIDVLMFNSKEEVVTMLDSYELV